MGITRWFGVGGHAERSAAETLSAEFDSEECVPSAEVGTCGDVVGFRIRIRGAVEYSVIVIIMITA